MKKELTAGELLALEDAGALIGAHLNGKLSWKFVQLDEKDGVLGHSVALKGGILVGPPFGPAQQNRVTALECGGFLYFEGRVQYLQYHNDLRYLVVAVKPGTVIEPFVPILTSSTDERGVVRVFSYGKSLYWPGEQ